jgi:hypothetical protein
MIKRMWSVLVNRWTINSRRQVHHRTTINIRTLQNARSMRVISVGVECRWAMHNARVRCDRSSGACGLVWRVESPCRGTGCLHVRACVRERCAGPARYRQPHIWVLDRNISYLESIRRELIVVYIRKFWRSHPWSSNSEIEADRCGYWTPNLVGGGGVIM